MKIVPVWIRYSNTYSKYGEMVTERGWTLCVLDETDSIKKGTGRSLITKHALAHQHPGATFNWTTRFRPTMAEMRQYLIAETKAVNESRKRIVAIVEDMKAAKKKCQIK